MVARAATTLPTRGPWAYEPKLAGFRALAIGEGGRLRLQPRQKRPLTGFFPEIVEDRRVAEGVRGPRRGAPVRVTRVSEG
jgi:ATP-dependent DNA ligase